MPGRQRKYGRNHDWACTCDGCTQSHVDHNLHKICNCDECLTHRQHTRDRLPFTAGTLRGSSTVATVNFCEREQCQTMGKSHVMGQLRFMTDQNGEAKLLEICPGCVGEFMEWLDKAPETERPKAYKEAWVKTEPTTDKMDSAQLFALAIEASKKEMEG